MLPKRFRSSAVQSGRVCPHSPRSGLTAAAFASHASSGSVSSVTSADLVEEEVFESERWLSLKGWGADNLRPGDPGHFVHMQMSSERFPEVIPCLPQLGI